MAEVIVMLWRDAQGNATPHDGRWLVRWNPHTAAGILELTSAEDRSQARRFRNSGVVHSEWRTVSKRQRTRPWDHAPNRPLTGINLIIEEAE